MKGVLTMCYSSKCKEGSNQVRNKCKNFFHSFAYTLSWVPLLKGMGRYLSTCKRQTSEVLDTRGQEDGIRSDQCVDHIHDSPGKVLSGCFLLNVQKSNDFLLLFKRRGQHISVCENSFPRSSPLPDTTPQFKQSDSISTLAKLP